MNDVKQKMDVQSAQLQKQLASIEEYKRDVEELTPWIANAEIESEISSLKPTTIKDIEKHLVDVNVIFKFNFQSFNLCK